MSRKSYLLIVIISALFAACYEPVSDRSKKFEARTPGGESNEIDERTPSIPETNVDPINSDTLPEKMNDTTKPTVAGFRENVTQSLSRNGLTIGTVANESNSVEKRVFDEYGAVYLTKAKPPSKAMFTTESEVLEFQNSAGIAREAIGGVVIELQPMAMESLKAARADAQSKGLNISPRDGIEAGRRSYAKTLSLWKSRFEPGLEHWKSKGRLKDDQISRLRALPIKEQVAEVLILEQQGIYFNTFFNNSILYSVAAPGTSQHLSMLAFDITEFSDKRVHEVLADHGWFRTVQNDAPHFTYLGYKETELASIGLKKVNKKDGSFWIPDL